MATSDEDLIAQASKLVEGVLAGLERQQREPEEALLIFSLAARITDNMLGFMVSDSPPQHREEAVRDVATAQERLPQLLTLIDADHMRTLASIRAKGGSHLS